MIDKIAFLITAPILLLFFIPYGLFLYLLMTARFGPAYGTFFVQEMFSSVFLGGGKNS